MKRFARAAAALCAALLMLLPAVAAACPACLGNSRNLSVLKLLGVLILTPFVVFGLVYRAVKRAQTIDRP